MKTILNNVFKSASSYLILITILFLWVIFNLGLIGCTKQRLFTHVDSIAAVMPQFHFVNTFTYDKSLAFSVDGVQRELTNTYSSSSYYPSSSTFNPNPQKNNSKLIGINDPSVKSLYSTYGNFQFKPGTSYVMFTTYTAYDYTKPSTKQTVTPTLRYYPEDINHPFDGSTWVRLFNCTTGDGNSPISLTISPFLGTGTNLTIGAINPDSLPHDNKATSLGYSLVQPGMKVISANIAFGSKAFTVTFKPTLLDNSKNYTFFLVGDVVNFIQGVEERPTVYIMEDGKVQSMQQLTFSSLTYPRAFSTTATVRVINGAYNIKSFFYIGQTHATSSGIDVKMNNVTFNVNRWPIYKPEYGLWIEDIHDVATLADADVAYTAPGNLASKISVDQTLDPNIYAVSIAPNNGIQKPFLNFSSTIEANIDYTLCLLPINNTNSKCGQLLLQSDNNPVDGFHKLRFINLMGGTTSVDIHQDTPDGPIIALGVPFGQDYQYVPLKADLQVHNLYVTNHASTTPLFTMGSDGNAIHVQYKPGNSGTFYLMGLLPGMSYSGDPGPYGPYVYYHQDAYTDNSQVFDTNQNYFTY